MYVVLGFPSPAPLANIDSKAAPAPTIASTARSLVNLLNPNSYHQETPKRNLLRAFSGVINPGEMVLVVGKPGSGCSTFLKTLAGLRGEFHDTRGSLLYGDKEIQDNARDSVLTTFSRMISGTFIFG